MVYLLLDNGVYVSAQTSNTPTSVYSNVTTGTSVTTSPNDCVKQVNKEMISQRASVDLARSVSLATNNGDFKSNISGHNSKYYQTFGIWSWDSNCNITLKGVKVFYSVSNATSFVHYVVVTESPQLNNVINVTTQTPVFYTPPPIWSGYEMQASASANHPSTPVYEAYALWSVPSVSVPAYSSCSSTPCEISVWDGLVSGPGGNLPNGTTTGGIVQAGSESDICNPLCISHYSLWTEFYPSIPSVCLTVNSGDQVYSDVTDEKQYGGNVNLYDIVIGDVTQSTACTQIVAQPFDMGIPMFAEFISETPKFSAGSAVLPQFTPFGMQGHLDDPINGYYSMSNSYNLNLYNFYTLTDAGGIGGSIGFGPASSGSFTSTWFPNCVVPLSGSWTTPSSCAIALSSTVTGDIVIPSGVKLYLPWENILSIDLTTHHILGENNSTLWIKGQVK